MTNKIIVVASTRVYLLSQKFQNPKLRSLYRATYLLFCIYYSQELNCPKTVEKNK